MKNGEKMKHMMLAAVTMLVVAGSGTAWGADACGCCGTMNASVTSCHAETAQGAPADLTLTSLDGDTFRLADQEGHPVALVCLAVDSDPESDSVALTVQQAHKDSPDHAIWGVACSDSEAAASFVERLGLDYPILLDPGCHLMKAFGFENCPIAVVVDSGGRYALLEQEDITEGTLVETTELDPAHGEALDPVCKMRVTRAAAAASLELGGKTYYFCNPGCRYTFAREPDKYLGN